MASVLTVAAASAEGISWNALQTSAWRRVYRGVYASSRLALTNELQLTAARARLPDCAVFSGKTAAWLHGVEIAPCSPVEATMPPRFGVSRRPGLCIRRRQLEPSEVVRVGGLLATSPVRTAADLGSEPDIAENVVLLDLVLRGGLVSRAKLEAYAAARAGRKGSARLRRALDLADEGSESPMETRLRLLLIHGGLPRPICQARICDANDAVIARVDLYYPDQRLCIEYDGSTHRESLEQDNRRQNRLLAAGFALLRFTASDLRDPERVVATVRGALLGTPPQSD